jgi:hypothetical protein
MRLKNLMYLQITSRYSKNTVVKLIYIYIERGQV